MKRTLCPGEKQASAADLLKSNKTESQRVSGRREDIGEEEEEPAGRTPHRGLGRSGNGVLSQKYKWAKALQIPSAEGHFIWNKHWCQ